MNDNHAQPLATHLEADPTLDALPLPAAVFDARLGLESANAAFVALCVAEASRGALLHELLPPAGTPPPMPPDTPADYLARGAEGQAVAVTVQRSGARTGVTLKRLVESAASQVGAAMDALNEQSRVQNALLTLSREVALAGSEDELIGCIGRSIRALFPGRYFCIRFVDPKSLALTALYAEGRLLENARNVLAMRKNAAEKVHLDARRLEHGHVRLTEEHPLVFAGAIKGFATPLAAAGQLFGLLNLEYAQGLVADLSRDEKLLSQLANQAAVGIRNARLIDELTFMKKTNEELIENANALILAVTSRGRVFVFNKAMEQLSGFRRPEVEGKELFTLIPESEKPRIARVVGLCLAGEKVSNFETKILSREGAELPVVFSSASLRGASGEVEGVIAIGQDLSRQKELERRVIHADKLATLGQLAAGVVHEINNPLTTISLYADALMSKWRVQPADQQDVEKVRSIQDASGRILKFARELVTYARPATERPEPLDVHKILDQAVVYCDHSLKEASVQLSRSYGDKLPVVKGVRTNLVQVFVNLLTNAAHAMPEEGGKVELRTSAQQSGLQIEIADSGKGIDARHLPHIFEPFYTTKPEGKGTGLGLSIVQGIVEAHGGSISVRSQPGQGTTFTVWLPERKD